MKKILTVLLLLVLCVPAWALDFPSGDQIGGDNVVSISRYSSFATAVTAIGSSTRTLLITKPTTVSATVVLPATLTLAFTGSGQLSISAGVTVTYLGSTADWPVRQLFTGAGATPGVDFTGNTNLQRVYPQWFAGADMGAQIANTLASLPSTGGVIDARRYTGTQTNAAALTLNKSVELLLGPVTMQSAIGTRVVYVTGNSVAIRGEGKQSTIQSTDPRKNAYVIEIAAGVKDVTIENLSLVGSGRTFVAGVTDPGDIIHASCTSGSQCENITVKNNYFTLGNQGVRFHFVNHSRVINNTFEWTHTGGQQTMLTSVNETLFADNTCLTSGSGTAADCLDINWSAGFPSKSNVVRGNTVNGTYTAEGIVIDAGYTTVSHNVLNLTSSAPVVSGILVATASNTAGVVVQNTVSDNTVYISASGGMGARGIATATVSSFVTGPVATDITGNTVVIDGAGPGIIVRDYSDKTKVIGNTVTGGTGATSDGIIVNGGNVTDTKVMANHILGAGRYGILSNSSQNVTISSNDVTGAKEPAIRVAGGNMQVVTNNKTHVAQRVTPPAISRPRGL